MPFAAIRDHDRRRRHPLHPRSFETSQCPAGDIAKAWAELMTRLGYACYVAQGGDWVAYQRSYGAPGAGRIAQHPHQLARDGPARRASDSSDRPDQAKAALETAEAALSRRKPNSSRRARASAPRELRMPRSAMRRRLWAAHNSIWRARPFMRHRVACHESAAGYGSVRGHRPGGHDLYRHPRDMGRPEVFARIRSRT